MSIKTQKKCFPEARKNIFSEKIRDFWNRFRKEPPKRKAEQWSGLKSLEISGSTNIST